jgi:hypothetical protein
MTPDTAKRLLWVSLLWTMFVEIVRRKGVPESRRMIGMAFAYVFASFLVAFAPALGAAFAVLIAVAVSLESGTAAFGRIASVVGLPFRAPTQLLPSSPTYTPEEGFQTPNFPGKLRRLPVDVTGGKILFVSDVVYARTVMVARRTGTRVSSAYRDPVKNAAVQGATASDHLCGFGVDYTGFNYKSALREAQSMGAVFVLDEGDHGHVSWLRCP